MEVGIYRAGPHGREHGQAFWSTGATASWCSTEVAGRWAAAALGGGASDH